MYYPYLRGRQNELLAIKELLSEGLLSKRIIPIIEPVKVSPTLVNTINTFNEKERELIIIGNPKVGSFESDSRNSKNSRNAERIKESINSETIQYGWIVDDKLQEHLDTSKSNGKSLNEVYCIFDNADSIKYLDGVDAHECKKVTPYAPVFRRIGGDRIQIFDAFNKKEKNADYEENTDEFFSNSHLYYEEDGYVGFSDYSVIGKEYVESGFAPYAVAIHIVYFDENADLRIHHFISDEKDDIRDPGKKFYQAVGKLVEWNKTQKLDTYGIKTFEEIYNAQSYPGLGFVKKLSLMHHLELIGKYLDQ